MMISLRSIYLVIFVAFVLPGKPVRAAPPPYYSKHLIANPPDTQIIRLPLSNSVYRRLDPIPAISFFICPSETLRGISDMLPHQVLISCPIALPIGIKDPFVFGIGVDKVKLPKDAEVPAPFDRFERIFVHPDERLVGAGCNHVAM
jgi:hypothetical protein